MPVKKTAKPTAKRARRNSDYISAAAALSEQFHGRPVKWQREIDEPDAKPEAVAQLGKLLMLEVETRAGKRVKIEFGKGVRLCANPHSKSLYAIGGDQALDLKQLGLSGEAKRDHVDIGEILTVEYHTSKDFHNFEPTDYTHEFGEEGGRRPRLGYDTINQRVYFSGGEYQIKREGIID